MAFFKFRTPGQPAADVSQAARPPAQSIEVMRRRAKHRLIGAAVLVLAGVVGFPLLFDSQPRVVAVDIPIDIPDKAKVKPLVLGATPSATPSVVPAAPAAEPAASAPAPTPVAAPTPTPVTTPAPLAKPPAAPAIAPEKHITVPAPAPTPAPEKPAAKPAAPADDGAKARALLDGKEEAPAATGRFVVQVGAFSDAAKLREVRQKLEKAGLKTYTQVVDTKDGKRTRVRVGPFGAQTEADKAAARVKGLDLPASVLKM